RPSPMRTIRNLPGPLSSAKGRLARLILEEARELCVDASDVLRSTGEEGASARFGDLLQDLGLGIRSVRNGEDARRARVFRAAFLSLPLASKSPQKLIEVDTARRVRSIRQDDDRTHRPFRIASGGSRGFDDRVVELGVAGSESAVDRLLE